MATDEKRLFQPDLFIPDGTTPEDARTRCTHLGIGAHADDLEFMAYHGVSHCYEQANQWFGGITCTDGGGCSRSGKYADYSDEEMIRLRAEEQRAAARIGQYNFIHQLALKSTTVKNAQSRNQLVEILAEAIAACQPEVLYTHNPADSHPTHVAVCLAVIEAIRCLPPQTRPLQVLGCEVWRSLDWLPPEDKVALDVSRHPQLAEQLHACFDTQIAGGKNYAQAVIGRSLSNATFYNANESDGPSRLWFAIDLTPLARDDSLSVAFFTGDLLARFQQNVAQNLTR
ncbi:MAG: PIG-L deacetylase family protein [Coraliomargaritaceae bacterium]